MPVGLITTDHDTSVPPGTSSKPIEISNGIWLLVLVILNHAIGLEHRHLRLVLIADPEGLRYRPSGRTDSYRALGGPRFLDDVRVPLRRLLHIAQYGEDTFDRTIDSDTHLVTQRGPPLAGARNLHTV